METENNLYLGKDLGDYANTDVSEVDGYGRTTWLKAILPNSADINVYSTGGYQGTKGYVIYLDDYTWIIKEAYGSCSYCDGMIGADDKAEYALSMCRNAYCLENKKDAIRFLDNQDGWGWDKIRSNLKEMIQK